MSGTSKNVRIRNVSYIAACFGGIVTTIPRRFIDRCRNVDLAAVSNAQFLYPYLKSCALHRVTGIVTLFKKNQRRMYDCKAWPCNCSLDWVLRRTTERSFTNELGDVTPIGAPSCCFRNNHRPCYRRRNLPSFRSRRCRCREGGQSGPGSVRTRTVAEAQAPERGRLLHRLADLIH
jgi:hypothetical protein